MDRADNEGFEQAIERAIDRAEREWRKMRVVRADRAALREDLRRELDGAADEGVLPDQLIGPDIGRFARELAASAGVRRAPYQLRRLLLAGLVGALPGLVLAWILIWHWWWLPDMSTLVRYGASAALFVAGALIGIHRGMRGDPAQGRTVAAMAVLVPVGGALVVPVVMGFASLTGYRTAAPVLLVEAAIVGGFLAGGAILARRWALAPVLGFRVRTAGGADGA